MIAWWWPCWPVLLKFIMRCVILVHLSPTFFKLDFIKQDFFIVAIQAAETLKTLFEYTWLPISKSIEFFGDFSVIFIDNFAITEENWLEEWKENSLSKNELLAISIGPRSDHSPPMSATKLRPCWNQVWPSALFGRYLGTKWGPLHCHCSRMMKTIVIVWKQKSQTTKVERENICEDRLFAEKISSELFDNAQYIHSVILLFWPSEAYQPMS